MMRLAALGALVLAGCSVLAPRPDRTRYYVLTAFTDGGPPPAGASLGGVAVGLGPVTLPSYLERGDVATRVGPNQIGYSPTARWAEPLQANLVRVLARDLEQELGQATIMTFPWFGATRLDYTIEVDVQRFECDEGGTATLAARWTIRDGRSRAVLRADVTNISEPATEPGAAGGIAALSRALAGLGRELAEGIRRLHAGRK